MKALGGTKGFRETMTVKRKTYHYYQTDVKALTKSTKKHRLLDRNQNKPKTGTIRNCLRKWEFWRQQQQKKRLPFWWRQRRQNSPPRRVKLQRFYKKQKENRGKRDTRSRKSDSQLIKREQRTRGELLKEHQIAFTRTRGRWFPNQDIADIIPKYT